MYVVEVKNYHSGNTGVSGWLNKWKKSHGMKPTDSVTCERCNTNEAEHGGHVIMTDGNDKKRYIVPLCAHCNELKDEKPFFVNKDMLALASDIKDL